MRFELNGTLTPALDRAAILSSDLCLSCNICTLACPVVAGSDEFRGPKAVGPQAQRFRHPRFPIPDDSLSLCSGCGICSQVCPHGVQVAEINILANARLAGQSGVPLRDQFLARPELLGRLAWPAAGLVNGLLRSKLVRRFLDKVIRIDEKAPLPAFASRPLRARLPKHRLKALPVETEFRRQVAYFHGCSAAYFEPALGELTIGLLEALGYEVILPPQNCCGLALQSNGMLQAARRAAEDNLKKLETVIESGLPILGSSTSCTLAIKHAYRTILGVSGRQVEALAGATRDVFEFLVWDEPEVLGQVPLNPVERSVLYHAPCQLGGHGVGTPALSVLRRIPGLEVHLSGAACCGGAGTYGLKSERYQVARTVGEELFQQARELQVDMVVTDSETCRWWIEGHSGVKNVHPIQILAWSMGLTSDPAIS